MIIKADTIDNRLGNVDVADTNDIGDGLSHYIGTRNDDLAWEHHPVTGVEFESKVVVTLPSGEIIEGVFPEFDSEYAASLPETIYLKSNDTQLSYANKI
ncbi:hypothetical protein ACFVHQ_12170 [Actinomycetes bacterium NPDC127524]